ncbi:MAG TPA: cell division protein ZapB [Bryobacteraceae bacterium]|jgi:FtsZ-binding cell division protein ZapB
MEAAAPAPLPDEDALASLEDRIRRAVELVATLRAERDAAVAELDAVRRAAGSALADSQKSRQEIDSLRSERKQVRTRIEKLLGQMDLL